MKTIRSLSVVVAMFVVLASYLASAQEPYAGTIHGAFAQIATRVPGFSERSAEPEKCGAKASRKTWSGTW